VTSLATLLAATAILVAIPGPNVALIVANTLRYGTRSGIVTVLGTTVGIGLQLALVVLGLVAVVETLAAALAWVRWAGVAYLVYLGVRMWRAAPGDLAAVGAAPAMFWRGCLVAVLNPKTLLFNAAFIPQFVAADSATPADFGLVAAVYLAVLLLGDSLWALFARSARPLLVGYPAIRGKLAGAFLMAAGAGLALTRR
jgi:threonine/homoserine/homoserine lactone efflux protein